MSILSGKKTKGEYFVSLLSTYRRQTKYSVESFQSVEQRKDYAPSDFVLKYGSHLVYVYVYLFKHDLININFSNDNW